MYLSETMVYFYEHSMNSWCVPRSEHLGHERLNLVIKMAAFVLFKY